MREVEDAHQPVDEREPGGDQEVHRAEPEAGDREQEERAHACHPDAEQPLDELGLREQLLRVAACARRVPGRARSRRARAAPTTPRFCSTSSTVVSSASRSSTRATSATSSGREPLRRLVDEQHPVVVQQRARDRDHLLLPARQRAGALRRALLELREELVDEVVARLRVAFREAKVLRDGEAGEDVAVLRDVADAVLDDRDASAVPVSSSSPRRTEPRRSTSPRIARSVVVLPTPLRPSSAVTPPSGTSNVTPCRTCDCPRKHMQVAHREQRPGGDRAHSASPRYADCTVSFAITAAGVSHASSAP